MAILNGRLPQATLAPITHAANGEQAYLRRDAARAFLAMNAESEAKFSVTLRVSSARVAYRPLKDQEYFWHLYETGQGNLAARPGTSNHGWGLAVDLATEQMRHIVDQIGGKYGFAKKWSDAPTEWWHIKWRPGVRKGHAPFGYGTIHPGARGFPVYELKKLMRKHKLGGFRLSRSYGPGAVNAVKRFQKMHYLKPDGIVGPATWHRLQAS